MIFHEHGVVFDSNGGCTVLVNINFKTPTNQRCLKDLEFTTSNLKISRLGRDITAQEEMSNYGNSS